MLKHYFLFFLFAFVKFIFSQEVTATQNLPDNVLPSSEYIAEITIKNEWNNNNFLRFSQMLPPGFTATELESMGGKFKVKHNIVRISWITAPASKEFVIKYKVTVSDSAKKENLIKGRVYYYINTNKHFFELKHHQITVSNQTAITKSDVLPESDTVNNEESKPIIEALPQNLQSDTSLIDTLQLLTEVNDSSKNATIEIIELDSVIDTVHQVKNKSSTIFISDSLVTKIDSTIKKEAEKPVTIELKEEIEYRVQIAFVSEKKEFKEIEKLSSVDFENGKIKYFSGNFSSYEQANAHKIELISKGYKDVFIVPFKNGKVLNKN